MPTYTRQEIMYGTGFSPGARFVQVEPGQGVPAEETAMYRLGWDAALQTLARAMRKVLTPESVALLSQAIETTLSEDPVRDRRDLSAERRFLNDATFHAMVESLRHAITGGYLSPDELQDALRLAERLAESERGSE